MNGKDCITSASEKNIDKTKRVSFNPNVHIQNMHVWTFAYREARKNDWQSIAADRYRFNLRKQRMETLLSEIGFFFILKK